MENKKIIVEKGTFEYNGKTYSSYFIVGNIKGREVRVALMPPDKGGWVVLDILFTDRLKYTIREAFPIGKELIDGHYDDCYDYYSDFKIHTHGWKPSYLLKDIYRAIKTILALLALLPLLLYEQIKSKFNK